MHIFKKDRQYKDQKQELTNAVQRIMQYSNFCFIAHKTLNYFDF